MRGAVEIQLLRFEQAIRSYEKALSIDAREPVAAFGLGVASIWVQDWNRAVRLFQLLSRVWTDKPFVWLNLAIALNHVRNAHDGEAEEAAKRVLKLAAKDRPESQKAALLLSTIYWTRQDYCKVIDVASQLLAGTISTDTRASATTMLVRAETYLSRWEALDSHFAQMVELVESRTQGIFAQDFFYNPQADLRTHRLCAATNTASAIAIGRSAVTPPATNGRCPLHVGFLSSDFREHAVSNAFVRCFELLCARKRLKVHAYSTANPTDGKDPLRARIVTAAHAFVDMSATAIESMAKKIRDDGIDVLVDLNGHTANSRIRVFALRPARVNVNYLGFPGTTGSGFHDWIIGDPVVTPDGEEAHFSEKIWRLPHTYMPTDDRRERTVAPTPANVELPVGHFVFACLNSNRKLNADVFDVWCEILRKVETSVLWLRACPPEAQENLLKNAEKRGVKRTRIVFAPWRKSMTDHLARVSLADLALDTWPYNMHVTCADTLYAGVPVLTLKGRTFPGRVAESILRAAGLADLVAETRGDYVAMAVQIATDPARLADLKRRVLQSRTMAPLFNSTMMTSALEEALIGIYEKETGITL